MLSNIYRKFIKTLLLLIIIFILSCVFIPYSEAVKPASYEENYNKEIVSYTKGVFKNE